MRKWILMLKIISVHLLHVKYKRFRRICRDVTKQTLIKELLYDLWVDLHEIIEAWNQWLK